MKQYLEQIELYRKKSTLDDAEKTKLESAFMESSELAKNMQTLMKEKDVMIHKMKNEFEAVIKLKDQIQPILEENEQLKNIKEANMKEIDMLTSKIQQTGQITSEIADMDTILETTKVRIQELSDKNKKLKEENNDLFHKNEELIEIAQQQKEDLSKLLANEQATKNLMDKFEDALNMLSEENKALKNEVKAVKMKPQPKPIIVKSDRKPEVLEERKIPRETQTDDHRGSGSNENLDSSYTTDNVELKPKFQSSQDGRETVQILHPFENNESNNQSPNQNKKPKLTTRDSYVEELMGQNNSLINALLKLKNKNKRLEGEKPNKSEKVCGKAVGKKPSQLAQKNNLQKIISDPDQLHHEGSKLKPRLSIEKISSKTVPKSSKLKKKSKKSRVKNTELEVYLSSRVDSLESELNKERKRNAELPQKIQEMVSSGSVRRSENLLHNSHISGEDPLFGSYNFAATTNNPLSSVVSYRNTGVGSMEVVEKAESVMKKAFSDFELKFKKIKDGL